MMILKQSYLDELRNPNNYLSDIIIEFYFNYISSLYPSDSILLISPSISFLLANSDDDTAIGECLNSLDLPEKRLVIFPVNNGGTHWSLLVYYRDLNLFIHHDSMNDINEWDALELYKTVRGHVRRTESGFNVDKTKRFRLGDDLDRFWVGYTPQQTNGYDCGLYVMEIAKIICHWYCSEDPYKGFHWIREIRENVDVTLLRPRVLQLIEEASCGRLGSVSCTIEAAGAKHAANDQPEEAAAASDCGTSTEPASSTFSMEEEDAAACNDCGTFTEPASLMKEANNCRTLGLDNCVTPSGLTPTGLPEDGGANDCGTSTGKVLANDCGPSTVPALPLPLIDESVSCSSIEGEAVNKENGLNSLVN